LEVRDERLVQRLPQSVLKLPLVPEGGGGLVVHLRYRRRWARNSEVVGRLTRGRRVLAEQHQTLDGRAVTLEFASPGLGACTIELVHRASPGAVLPLIRVAVGELDGSADDADRAELRLLLEWLTASLFDARQGLPRSRRLPISLSGCTRDCVILGVSDTLVLELPENARDRGLRFWHVGLAPARGRSSSVVLEAAGGARRAPVGEWQVGGGDEWGLVEVPPGTLPPRADALRFSLRGREQQGLAAIAEPILLPGAGQSARWNLLVIDLDTMRADRLGCYGYGTRPTSERLDSLLADKGFAVFSNAHAPSPWTFPSTVRFLSSRYLGANTAAKIGPDTPMLAEIMRSNGYYCIAFTGGLVLRTPGFERGFHEYYWSRRAGKVEDSFPQAVQWLRSMQEPFFMFLHTYEPHMPYTRTVFCDGLPRGRFKDPAENWGFLPDTMGFCSVLSQEESLYVEALYDGGIRVACDAVAELFGVLDTLGLWDRTAVVLLSDHGEEFWDHFDLFAAHNQSLYGEMLRVPFVVYYPGRREAVRVEEDVSLVDMVPTVAELLQLNWGEPADGASLLPLMEGGRATRRLPILAHMLFGRLWEGTCIIHDGTKYIEVAHIGDGDSPSRSCTRFPEQGRELYRLAADPAERENLLAKSPALAAALAESLEAARVRALVALDSDEGAEDLAVQAELREQLRALGYVAGDE
jgi:arylsulfatase A-like enzyme